MICSSNAFCPNAEHSYLLTVVQKPWLDCNHPVRRFCHYDDDDDNSQSDEDNDYRRCEAPLSLRWEREVVQQLVVLAVLVATIRLVSSIQAMIMIVVNIITMFQGNSEGQMYWYCAMITILIKIEDNLEAKILLKGNLEGGGGRLQREQERALHLQLGGTSQVTF